MKYYILGGTGFIGNYLINFLLDQGAEVTALVRDESRIKARSQNLKLIKGDPMKKGTWQETLHESEIIINLVGFPVMTKWTEKNKQLILSSRVDSTNNVVEAMKNMEPRTFICANAVGYYGPRGDEQVDEQSGPGTDFLARVSVQWQESAQAAEKLGHRVIISRFPAVLGQGGGAMAKMLPVFRLGLGGKLGSGRQWFPWVHIFDLVRALYFLSLKNEIHGPVNICAPQQITNADFTRAMSKVLGRPALFRVPGLALKLIYGEVGQMLLTGQRCVPGILQKAGFEFKFPEIEMALADIAAR